MNGTEEVKSCSGKIFEVDTSVVACEMFGFMPGARFVTTAGEDGTMVGVAPLNSKDKKSPLVLWYGLDRHKGKVTSHFPFSKNDFVLV
jgi:hypothetical protein